MRSAGKFVYNLIILGGLAGVFASSTSIAAELLTNTGLELSPGPAGWTLTQSLVGLPGTTVSASEQLGAANEPASAEGELGMLVRPFAGNVGAFAGQNRALNWSLSTTSVAIGANRTFTFTGHSLVQGSSSVIVENMEELAAPGDYNGDYSVDAADYTIWRDTLGSTTDLRANGDNTGDSFEKIDQADYAFWKTRFGNTGHAAGTPSPTETFMKVEFLSATEQVLATHSIDLRDDTTPLDPLDPQVDVWRTHTLTGLVSPANTTRARVSVELTNGVASCSTCMFGSDLFLDNFSLNQTSAPFAGPKLIQVGEPGQSAGTLNVLGAPTDWVVTKTGQDNVSFSLDCCPPTDPNKDNHTPGGITGLWLRSFAGGDGKISQTVPGVEGREYDFSAWSKWELGYIDQDPLHAETETTLTIEYLDASNALIGTALSLDLNGPDKLPATPDDIQFGDEVWRQFTVDGGVAPAGTAFVRVSAGAIGMGDSGINPQSAFFDDFSLIETMPGLASLSPVPEPATFALFGLALIGLMGIRRRSN